MSARKIEQTAVLRDVDIPLVTAKRRDRVKAKLAPFEWLVVLTQDCDLDLDHHARRGTSPIDGLAVKKDKILYGVIVCPAFLAVRVLLGEYLDGVVTHQYGKSQADGLRQNHVERYHYIPAEYPWLAEDIVVDFKMAFAVPPDYLERWIRQHPESRVAVLLPPYRDRLTQRFANYFGRIAEPGQE